MERLDRRSRAADRRRRLTLLLEPHHQRGECGLAVGGIPAGEELLEVGIGEGLERGNDVRAWGLAQNRTDVKEGRGRLASTLVKDFNAEHPRAKYLPASKAPAPTVVVKVKPEKGRAVAKRVNVAEARAYAKKHGLAAGDRGTLSTEVMQAFAKTL